MYKKIPNINARDFATILNVNPYQTPFQLLEQKIENKYPFFGNKFTEHGNRYEHQALKTYEIQSGNSVDKDQKNIKHPEYSWITGRLDGITEITNNKKRKRSSTPSTSSKKQKTSKNCVVEIKCPLKKDRTEPLTLDNIPIYYWTQCQVYMNMIDCDIAHYVEYYIEPDADENQGKLYYIDVPIDKQWWENSIPKIKLFHDEVKKYKECGNLDSHPVRIEEKKWEELFLRNNI